MSVPPPPRPRRYTSPTGRIVVPVLFVVLLIVVLGRPILIAGLEDDPQPAVPVPTGDATGRTERPRGPTRLDGAYPKACLAEAARPRLGLVAASDGGTVAAASPTGTRLFALQAKSPIGFSASGKFIATAGAEVWTERGTRVGSAFERPIERWAWSPTADCIAGIDNSRLTVARPGEAAVVLLHGAAVSTFSFSPDGTQIVFAIAKGRSSGLWAADLRTGDVHMLQSSLGWTLMGWSQGMRPILFQEDPSSERASRVDLAFPPADAASRCGDEIVIINHGRLSNIGVSSRPRYISADRRFRYTAVACAPGGDLILVVRHEKADRRSTSMAVLRTDGTFVREVAQQSRLEDAPIWGPPGTGVVFAGDVAGEGAVGPLVWFLPEGGTARPTGLRVAKLGDAVDARLDWSATPPLGHPTS